jgi:ribosome-binding factor A
MSIRVERVRKKIKFLIANVLHAELKDPRKGFVTVVRCDLTSDFRQCRVHVSILADSDAEVRKVMRMLEDARGFVQTRVASGLSTRTTPHLEWVLDEGAQRSVEVGALLADLAAERAEREAAEAAAGGEAAEGEAAEGEAAEGEAAEGEAAEGSSAADVG